jgi:hypothetical protein
MLQKLGTHARHNVVGYIALFVALGGSSYAAVNLPANSVRAKQLHKDSITSAKVKDGSLLRRDFKAGQLPQGPMGLSGQDGADGADGQDGANGATDVTVRWASSGGAATAESPCQPGERATGGGFGSTTLHFVRSAPVVAADGVTPVGWSVTADSATFFSIYAVCAAP